MWQQVMKAVNIGLHDRSVIVLLKTDVPLYFRQCTFVNSTDKACTGAVPVTDALF